LGPYILVEVLLPGGTLLAFLLWLAQRLHRNGFSSMQRYLSRQLFPKAVVAAKPYPRKKTLRDDCEGDCPPPAASQLPAAS